MKLKIFIKKLLPVSINRFCNEMQNLRLEMKYLKASQDDIRRKLYDLDNSEHKLIQLAETMANKQEDSIVINKTVNENVINGVRIASEAVWAAIFNNTIVNCEWLLDKQFSPGRWAVRYHTLYVIFRILNEVRPTRILELGLGQSTRMTAQYSQYFKIQHEVVEHDQEWIDFFSNSFKSLRNTKITKLDRTFIKFKNADNVRAFKGFKDVYEKEHFDFIIIDAPLGGDMKRYSRVDVCTVLPNILDKDFIILIDDAERIGESETIKEMEQILANNGINYKKGKYSGQNDCVVICSNNLGFVTSM